MCLCFETFECATEDAVCKPDEADDGEVLVSSKGTCEPPPGPGDPCPENFCDDGLYCGPNAAGDDICQNKKDTGAECGSLIECKSELCELNASFAADPMIENEGFSPDLVVRGSTAPRRL